MQHRAQEGKESSSTEPTSYGGTQESEPNMAYKHGEGCMVFGFIVGSDFTALVLPTRNSRLPGTFFME